MTLRTRVVIAILAGTAWSVVALGAGARIWSSGGPWWIALVIATVGIAVAATVGAAAAATPSERRTRGLEGRIAALEAELDSLADVARTAEEVLESSPFGIFVTDAEGRIVSVNPTLARIVPLRGDPIGRRVIEVVIAAELHEMIERVLATEEPVELEFATATADLVAHAHPLPRGNVIVRIEDVTGRREAERARTDFVANVSHELRTPVSAIMGYVETVLLDADRLPPDAVALMRTIERNARRLRDLFEDLLRLHRIEARRRELPVGHHALLPILEEAVGPAMDRASVREQEFVLSCGPEIEAVVNPEALSAIVSNLALNASMYTPEGGRIEVRAVPDGRGFRIDVQDNGLGIAEKHHERIWERFYRVDDARSRQAGGTGLGLAIVKHYALAARHHVTLKSKEGEGSTFSVHLPDR